MDQFIPGLHLEWGGKSGYDPSTLCVQHEERSENSIITSVMQNPAYVCGSILQSWLYLLFVQFVG